MTQPPPHRRRLTWPRRHKRLTAGLAAFGALLVTGAIGIAIGSGKPAVKLADLGPPTAMASTKANTKANTKASAKPSAKASAAANTKASANASAKPNPKASASAKPDASPDCLALMKAWLYGGSSQQLAALEGDFSALDAAGHAFIDAAAGGTPSAGDISEVQTAAAALQSDAGAIEANAGPTCVPGLRANLMSGAADYSQVAIDADNAMNLYEAGQLSAAVADIDAGGALVDEGQARISAASQAAGNFGG